MEQLLNKSEVLKMINDYWKFDNYQKPVSSWHDKQDLLEIIAKFASFQPSIDFKTFNIDNGCMLVWKNNKPRPQRKYFYTTWDDYLIHRTEAMNITDEIAI